MTAREMVKMKNNFFLWYIVVLPAIMSFGILLTIFMEVLQPMMFSLLISYVYTVITIIKRHGFLSLYAIYLYTSAFFMYDCIFLSLLPHRNFLEQTFPFYYVFDEDIGFIFILCCFFVIYSGSVAYFYFRENTFRGKKKVPKKKNKILEQMGIFIFLCSLIPVSYKILLQLQFVMKNGYASMYSVGLESIQYPFWTTGAFFLLNTGYMLFFSSNPSKKKFIIITGVYILMFFFDSLKGGRGGLISLLTVTLYLLVSKYRLRLKVKQIFVFFALVLFLSVFLNNLRNSYDGKSFVPKVSLLNTLDNLFWAQTTSRAVPLLIIRGNLNYHTYPFLFYPFTQYVSKIKYNAKGNEIESLLYYNNPSQVLMGNVSVEASLSGSGYGSAFMGEAYEFFGFIGVVFFSIVLSYFLSWADSKQGNVRYLLGPIYYTFLVSIPMIPRKEIFQIIIYDLNFLLSTYFVILLVHILRKCKS